MSFSEMEKMMSDMKIKALAPWFGGKRNLASVDDGRKRITNIYCDRCYEQD